MLVRGRSLWKNGFAAAFRFPVKFLPGIFQEISAPPVSRYRSPQPNDRAQRVSERGSGIYPVSHILLTRRAAFFFCHMKHFTDIRIVPT
jgi:hypothetical protein